MSIREDPPVMSLLPAPLVLVVDDELTPRAIVCRMIRTLGYGCRSCPAAAPALRFLETHRGAVKLLLADLEMPRMDGGELLERARDVDPRLRVALMARPGGREVDELLRGYRDVPLLSKPVSFGALAVTLERLLGGPGRAPIGLPARPGQRPRRRPSGQHRS
jgi:CheY-like chemotaxis protein